MSIDETSSAKGSKPLFQIPPSLLLPLRSGEFTLYLKQEGNLVLYAAKGDYFTPGHRERLAERGIGNLYISMTEHTGYVHYLEENLGELLSDEQIPVRDRAKAWQDATTFLAREAFDSKLPGGLDVARFRRIRGLLQTSLRFLTQDAAFRELARMVTDGSSHYRHGVGVMVLAASLLATVYRENNEIMVACAMGALLHDIGKLELPSELFERPPDTLSVAETARLRSHPALGVGICSSLPLPQETLQCILFHHELLDGSGYPSGAKGDLLPEYAKVLALCNRYDNLVRGLPGQDACRPFEALSRIKKSRNQYDPAFLERLIHILAEADLT